MAIRQVLDFMTVQNKDFEQDTTSMGAAVPDVEKYGPKSKAHQLMDISCESCGETNICDFNMLSRKLTADATCNVNMECGCPCLEIMFEKDGVNPIDAPNENLPRIMSWTATRLFQKDSENKCMRLACEKAVSASQQRHATLVEKMTDQGSNTRAQQNHAARAKNGFRTRNSAQMTLSKRQLMHPPQQCSRKCL